MVSQDDFGSGRWRRKVPVDAFLGAGESQKALFSTSRTPLEVQTEKILKFVSTHY